MNDIIIGRVFSVEPNKVKVQLDEINTQLVYYYNGLKYSGPQIQQYLKVKFLDMYIILKIESEEILKKELKKTLDEEQYINGKINGKLFYRVLNCSIIGAFEDNVFINGPKYSPIIFNEVCLLSENEKQKVNEEHLNSEINITIGKNINTDGIYKLPIHGFFNSHIGIFGNTGSGKSNTLSKIYNELIDKYELNNMNFIIIDFNGEYTNDKVITNDKKIYNLNTRDGSGDKIVLSEKELLDEEVLSIIYEATDKTQKPFLKRVINNKNKNKTTLFEYIEIVLNNIKNTSSHPRELIGLLEELFDKVNNVYDFKDEKKLRLNSITYHNKDEQLYYETQYTNDFSKNNLKELFNFETELDTDINIFDELEIRIMLNLISSLIKKNDKYDNISPLLNRIKARNNTLKKVLEVGVPDEGNEKLDGNSNLIVYNFRNCNQEMKKILPLILVKKEYKNLKNKNEKASNKKILQFIIDEAHNILSRASNRESEQWKDYRLDIFEEIIKEGRKFGMYLTISSQRPGDISPTIISQLHNFLIHRLVNENDIELLKNNITTLGKQEFKFIPKMAKGMCIITGVSFQLSQIVLIDKLESSYQPDSQDIEIELKNKTL